MSGDVTANADGSMFPLSARSFFYLSDLEVRLLAPDGTSVSVISLIGGSGNNFCQTLLDDESIGGNIQTTGTAPYTGSFRPRNPLSAFDGKSTAGTWTLQAQDFADSFITSQRRRGCQRR